MTYRLRLTKYAEVKPYSSNTANYPINFLEKTMLIWWNWLIGVTCSIIIFSLGMVIAPSFVQEKLFDAMFFSSAQMKTILSNSAVSYILFTYRVLGAVMVGWMISLLFILAGSFRQKQREGWYAVTGSIVVWFLLDSGVSISAGYWQNAVFNVVFFVLFIIPLAATFHRFSDA
jgi:hypothetical protein